MICWRQIESFHVFYKHISDIHNPSIAKVFSFETHLVKTEGEEDIADNTGENLLVKGSNSELSIKREHSDSSCSEGDADDDNYVDEDGEQSSASEKEVVVKKKQTKKEKRSNLKGAYGRVTEADDELIRKHFKMVCDICGVNFETCAEVKSHYKSAHNTNGYLKCCDRKFYSRLDIMGHIQYHTDPLKCEICGKIFAEARTLKNHMDTHRPEKRIYHCDQCPKTFLKPYHLDTHHQVHEDESQMTQAFICEICAKVMKNKVNFDYHMKNKHRETPLPRIQCDICFAWLKNKGSLRHHKQNKHDESNQKHLCTDCGKEYPSIGTLRTHKFHVHKLTRAFKCDVCEKAFKLAYLLREHMTTHTGEVLYTCPFCPATMNSSANLYAHKKKIHPVEWAESKKKM